MTFDEQTIRLFDNETKSLESQIQILSDNDTFSIPEIVQTYYLATNVDSLATVMSENFKENPSVIEKTKSVLEEFQIFLLLIQFGLLSCFESWMTVALLLFFR